MKPETEKQMAATLKAFKPIEAYLQQQKKLTAAFDALDEKVARTEQDHKTFLQKAGALEAKRLLGEVSDAEAETLDTGLTQIRDQQDRLTAARQALALQKAELDKQIRPLYDQAAHSLTQLKRAIEVELEQEMQQAVVKITAAVNSLYALYSATGMGMPSRDIMGIKIPSLLDGTNLFQEPVVFHPLNNDVVRSYWDSDADAKALHEKLRDFGVAYSALRRDERDLNEQEMRTEREAESRRHATVAA